MFLYTRWLELDLPTRIKIANDFGIVKKNSTHVSDNTVVSDGYLIQDVEAALNIDALQKHLNTNETDMAILWGMLVYPVTEIEPEKVVNPQIEGDEIELTTSKTTELVEKERVDGVMSNNFKLPVTESTDETEKINEE